MVSSPLRLALWSETGPFRPVLMPYKRVQSGRIGFRTRGTVAQAAPEMRATGGNSTVGVVLAVSPLHDDGPCDAVAHALLILREREEHDDDVEEEGRRRERHEVAQNRLSKRDWSAVDAHHLQLERALSE